MSPRVLGVIPARSGSKRVPNKNLRVLRGKPLIAWTIEAAHKATKLTSCVVSTECANIAQVANLYGAYVIKRPDELATDDATSGAVCKHALEWMGVDDYDIVVLLHPTSPVRNWQHIDQAVDLLWQQEMSWLASVEELPRKCGIVTHGDSEKGIWDILGVGAIHMLNASIYAFRTEAFRKYPNLINTPMIALKMDRAHSVDINDELDFAMAELALANSQR